MNNIFYCADTHFGHDNIVNFTNLDGSYLRPWREVSEHDEMLIHNWNSVVKPEDTVYLLGDATINKKHLPKIARLMGKKILVKGNHDTASLQEYALYFEDVVAYHLDKKKRFICSHIPLHIMNFERMGINVHGHTHGQHVVNPVNRYLCVSMESINYTPIEQSELLELIKKLI